MNTINQPSEPKQEPSHSRNEVSESKKYTDAPIQKANEANKDNIAPIQKANKVNKTQDTPIQSKKQSSSSRKNKRDPKKAKVATAQSIEQWEFLSKIFLVLIYIPLILVIRELEASEIPASGIPYLILDWIIPLIVADALHRYYLEEYRNRNLRWFVYSGVFIFGLLMLTNSLTYYTFLLGGFYGLIIVFTKRFGYSFKQHMLSCLIAVQITIVLSYYTDIITSYGALLLFTIAIMIVFFEKEFKMIMQEQRIPRFSIDAVVRMVVSEVISVAIPYALLNLLPKLFVGQYDFNAIQYLLISLVLTLIFYAGLLVWPKIARRIKK